MATPASAFLRQIIPEEKRYRLRVVYPVFTPLEWSMRYGFFEYNCTPLASTDRVPWLHWFCNYSPLIKKLRTPLESLPDLPIVPPAPPNPRIRVIHLFDEELLKKLALPVLTASEANELESVTDANLLYVLVQLFNKRYIHSHGARVTTGQLTESERVEFEATIASGVEFIKQLSHSYQQQVLKDARVQEDRRLLGLIRRGVEVERGRVATLEGHRYWMETTLERIALAWADGMDHLPMTAFRPLLSGAAGTVLKDYSVLARLELSAAEKAAYLQLRQQVDSTLRLYPDVRHALSFEPSDLALPYKNEAPYAFLDIKQAFNIQDWEARGAIDKLDERIGILFDEEVHLADTQYTLYRLIDLMNARALACLALPVFEGPIHPPPYDDIQAIHALYPPFIADVASAIHAPTDKQAAVTALKAAYEDRDWYAPKARAGSGPGFTYSLNGPVKDKAELDDAFILANGITSAEDIRAVKERVRYTPCVETFKQGHAVKVVADALGHHNLVNAATTNRCKAYMRDVNAILQKRNENLEYMYNLLVHQVAKGSPLLVKIALLVTYHNFSKVSAKVTGEDDRAIQLAIRAGYFKGYSAV